MDIHRLVKWRWWLWRVFLRSRLAPQGVDWAVGFLLCGDEVVVVDNGAGGGSGVEAVNAAGSSSSSSWRLLL